jgi:hypothetical protein
MAGKPRNVDLGPMYLQVGEDAGPQGPTTPGAAADAGDVARFESLLRRGGREQRQDEVAPESLLGPLLGTEPAPLGDAGEIGAEIAHLWVGTGLRSDREVRMGLRESILPDTSVRLCEAEGRLRIEFTCGTARVADWLDRRLPALARELGTRLSRPLELAVFLGDGGQVGARHWPGDD